MGRKIGEDPAEHEKNEIEPGQEPAAKEAKAGAAPGENAGEEQEKPAASKKRTRVISWIVIAAAAVVLVFSLVNIFDITGENFANSDVYKEIKQVAEGSGALPTEATGDPRDRKIDFDALRVLNDEICAWIYVPNTNIDYPVAAGDDNDYYISHDANKEQSRAGAIFLDYNSDPSFLDKHTLVYGHRMNDGSMFADLHKYENDKFLQENPEVFIYLPDGRVNVYRIFRAGVVDEYDEAYTLSFGDDAAFENYLGQMEEGTGFVDGTKLSVQDKIVTLSTCVWGQETDRYIVQAVLEK